MFRLQKAQIRKRMEAIKALILTEQPFSEPLARLYLDLTLQGSHAWVVETYHFLCLYIPEDKEYLLYHPALLQGLLNQNEIKQAQIVMRYLAKHMPEHSETKKFIQSFNVQTKSTLPAYTPLTSLSKYAQKPISKTVGKQHQLPPQWTRFLPTITPQELEKIGYYTQCQKLLKIPRLYRKIITANFDEMILNYLLHHYRSVVVLSGALLEMLLAVYLYHFLQLRRVQVGLQKKYIFNLNLSELIQVVEQKKLLPAKVLRLCHSARVQRNFIHPGKEILEKTHLSSSGAQICFLAVLEMIDMISKAKRRPHKNDTV